MFETETVGDAEVRAANKLNELIKRAADAPVLILLSGGSSLSLLPHIDTSLFTPHITLTVVDERYTQKDADSNFFQLSQTTFWREALSRGAAIIDPRPHAGEAHIETAERFDGALKAWDEAHPDGLVFATMGIGTDGHTAGVLPFPEDEQFFRTTFQDEKKFVAAYTVSVDKNPHTKRITTTLAYLTSHLSGAVLFAKGSDKVLALAALCAESGSLSTTPARILRDIPRVTLCTDVHL